MISKRLETVASFVPQGAVLLDVGSDHAYLPIELVEKGHIERAIAGEVVEGPYQSAVTNVESHGLTEKIQVRLANGLAAFEESDQVSVITIAGMGGRLIATILEEGLDKLANVEHLILQPNNREDELRSWLQEHDFQIIAESILEEAGKFYEIIVAETGEMKLSATDVRFGPFLSKEGSSVFIQKWQKEAAKLEFALSQIPEKNQEERQVLADKIQAKDIQKVMVALDIREETVAEAIEKGVDLIIVKHAPIFRPIKDLVASRPQNQIYINLIKHDIAVYVSHTNIDIVENGLNDWFCQLLGIEDTAYLQETGPERGIGRIGAIRPQTFKEFADYVKEVFGLDSLRMVYYKESDLRKTISKVAICGGSGQSFYPDALAKGADVYITGDIYYHTAQDMLSDGLLALDPGHYIEVLFIEKIAKLLNEWKKENAWSLEIIASQASTNPFHHI